MSAEPERQPLPFEPNKKRQKPAKATNTPPATSNKSQKKSSASNSKSGKEALKNPPYTREEMAIPEVVSQRMIRRVAIFCGVPTFLGISSLIASYLLIIYAGIKLPPIAVLLVNMGLFGLGVVGITYGVLSASWDVNRVGGLIGWEEVQTNWGIMVEGWRQSRQNKV